MRRLILTVLCLGLVSGPSGCKKDEPQNECLTEAAIMPGVGVRKANGAQYCLGARSSAVSSAAGADSHSEDLGRVGTRVVYIDANVSGIYAGAGEPRLASVYVDPGVEARTPGGVGIGSSEADVRAEFGEPAIDPFLGVWWYRDRGIAFVFESTAVSRIQVFSPSAE